MSLTRMLKEMMVNAFRFGELKLDLEKTAFKRYISFSNISVLIQTPRLKISFYLLPTHTHRPKKKLIMIEDYDATRPNA
jgi:hypothetical protein